jgi:hypothetical protein
MILQYEQSRVSLTDIDMVPIPALGKLHLTPDLFPMPGPKSNLNVLYAQVVNPENAK